MKADPGLSQQVLKQRRRASVRTALIVGAVALAIYAAFILSGVLGAA